MKTKEEMNNIKAAIDNLNSKLAELSMDELDQITGGSADLPIAKAKECSLTHCTVQLAHLEPLKMLNNDNFNVSSVRTVDPNMIHSNDNSDDIR